MKNNKLPIAESNWLEFNPNLTVSNSTYVVTSTHVVNTNILLAPNVTLIFKGGLITGSG